ncbi:hypothetical protein C0J52_09083 [Blattella germanica]|nr:hypothetical protein C0J52_09083 [Blattella germanica]
MRKEQLMSQVGVLLLVVLPAVLARVGDEGGGKRVPKQVHGKGAVVESETDHNAAETGFGAAGIGAHGKYFQYQHNPEHDHYEFGYRRGNDHHFQERYEKAAPHAGHFKTKGGYSEPVPQYHHPAGGKVTAKRQSPTTPEEPRVKRQKESQAPRLYFDVATGQVIDETTGQVFVLQPLN